jgi:hypothetical protein
VYHAADAAVRVRFFNAVGPKSYRTLGTRRFIIVLFTSGLYGDRALYAAIFGAIRLAGFIAYNIGYCTGDPKKRMMVRIMFALITL